MKPSKGLYFLGMAFSTIGVICSLFLIITFNWMLFTGENHIYISLFFIFSQGIIALAGILIFIGGRKFMRLAKKGVFKWQN